MSYNFAQNVHMSPRKTPVVYQHYVEHSPLADIYLTYSVPREENFKIRVYIKYTSDKVQYSAKNSYNKSLSQIVKESTS